MTRLQRLRELTKGTQTLRDKWRELEASFPSVRNSQANAAEERYREAADELRYAAAESLPDLLAAVDALRAITDLDDGDDPCFWPDMIANAMNGCRSTLAALDEEVE